MSNGHANLLVLAFVVLAALALVPYVRSMLNEQDEHDARRLERQRRLDAINRTRRP